MTKYQIIYWRDIPAQVKVRVGRQRFAKPLSPRFQVAIDAAAMQAGLTGSAEYLEEWRNGEWLEREADPDELVDSLVAEIENEFTKEQLQDLIVTKGWKTR